MGREPEDKGHTVAVQRALDAYARARGGYADRQTAIMYLLESLERDWNRGVAREGEVAGENVPTFEQMVRAAGRMAKDGTGVPSPLNEPIDARNKARYER